MKTTSRRGFLVLILVAVVSAGLVILGGKFAVNGEKWATLRANEHLTENGSFIGAGKVADRNGEVLAFASHLLNNLNVTFQELKFVDEIVLHIIVSKLLQVADAHSFYRTTSTTFDYILSKASVNGRFKCHPSSLSNNATVVFSK